MKTGTQLTIDDEIKKLAKEKGINMSEAAEEGIRRKLEFKEICVSPSKCEFCGKDNCKLETETEIEPETNSREQIKNPHLLTYLYPDDKWICNECLRKKCIGLAIEGDVHQ
jgi:hypothetical protein